MPVNDLDVFVNCPFDTIYKPIFNAIVFTVTRSGYRVRCALETDDASDNRFAKICGIIADCRLGIHDISRTEYDGDPPLPRFNMPLELGLFLGAKCYGTKAQKTKSCIIFDRERFRFQRYISDIAGQDIHAHGGDPSLLIRELAAWLRESRAAFAPVATKSSSMSMSSSCSFFLKSAPGNGCNRTSFDFLTSMRSSPNTSLALPERRSQSNPKLGTSVSCGLRVPPVRGWYRVRP